MMHGDFNRTIGPIASNGALFEFPVNAQAAFLVQFRLPFAVAKSGNPSYCWGALNSNGCLQQLQASKSVIPQHPKEQGNTTHMLGKSRSNQPDQQIGTSAPLHFSTLVTRNCFSHNLS